LIEIYLIVNNISEAEKKRKKNSKEHVILEIFEENRKVG
jgi:hypothetical protein